VISNERYVYLFFHLAWPSISPSQPLFHFTDPDPLYSIDPLSPKPADIQIMQLVDQAGRQGLRWTAAIRALEQQSSIPIDHSEFTEVVKGLTDEGVVRIVGERERRTIRRLAD